MSRVTDGPCCGCGRPNPHRGYCHFRRGTAPPAPKPPKGHPARPARTALSDDARRLAADYVPFALRLARRYEGSFAHLADDLKGEALFGLVQAAESFDPDNGVKFATFAARRILGAITNAKVGEYPAGYRATGRHDGAPDVEPLTPFHQPLDPAPPAESLADGDDAFEHLVRGLPERLALILRWHYRDGLTFSEIARRQGFWPSRVSRWHAEALDRVRERVEFRRDSA